MKIFLLFILFFLFKISGPELSFLKSVDVNGSEFLVDPLGSIFIVNNQLIEKYNEKGEKQKDYSNNNLGTISYVDVSDPFRVLLYYKDFNQLVFLDNYLAEIRSPIKLDDLKMDLVDIACSSVQGGFWVFCSQSKQLIYFDKNLTKQQESISLSSIIETDKKPDFLVEKYNNLYLNIPETGLLIFDKYGAYIKTVNINNGKPVQVIDEKILYYKNNTIFKYDPKFITTSSFVVPDSIQNVKSACILQKNLYVFKSKSFSLYKISNLE